MQKIKESDSEKYEKFKEYYEDYLKRCSLDQIKNIDFSFSLNDSGDVLIRLKPKAEFLKKLKKQKSEYEVFDDEEENLEKKK